MHGFIPHLNKVQLLGSVYSTIYIKDTLGVVKLKEVMVANSNSGKRDVTDAGNAIIYKQCCNRTGQLIIKDTIFTNNSNLVKGGTKRSNPKTLCFAVGLTIALECDYVQVEVYNLTMRNNSGEDGGHLSFFFAVIPQVTIKFKEVILN